MLFDKFLIKYLLYDKRKLYDTKNKITFEEEWEKNQKGKELESMPKISQSDINNCLHPFANWLNKHAFGGWIVCDVLCVIAIIGYLFVPSNWLYKEYVFDIIYILLILALLIRCISIHINSDSLNVTTDDLKKENIKMKYVRSYMLIAFALEEFDLELISKKRYTNNSVYTWLEDSCDSYLSKEKNSSRIAESVRSLVYVIIFPFLREIAPTSSNNSLTFWFSSISALILLIILVYCVYKDNVEYKDSYGDKDFKTVENIRDTLSYMELNSSMRKIASDDFNKYKLQ